MKQKVQAITKNTTKGTTNLSYDPLKRQSNGSCQCWHIFHVLSRVPLCLKGKHIRMTYEHSYCLERKEKSQLEYITLFLGMNTKEIA